MADNINEKAPNTGKGKGGSRRRARKGENSGGERRGPTPPTGMANPRPPFEPLSREEFHRQNPPSHLSTRSADRVEPLGGGGLVVPGVGELAPVPQDLRYAVDCSGYMAVADACFDQLCLIDKTFKMSVSRGVWRYYSTILLWRRLFLVRLGGQHSAEREFVARTMRSGPLQLPRPMALALSCLGDVVGVGGRTVHLDLPFEMDGQASMDGAKGAFGRAATENVWKFMTYPSPLVAYWSMKKEILGASPCPMPDGLGPILAVGQKAQFSPAFLGYADSTDLDRSVSAVWKEMLVTPSTEMIGTARFQYHSTIINRVSLMLTSCPHVSRSMPIDGERKSVAGSLAIVPWVAVSVGQTASITGHREAVVHVPFAMDARAVAMAGICRFRLRRPAGEKAACWISGTGSSEALTGDADIANRICEIAPADWKLDIAHGIPMLGSSSIPRWVEGVRLASDRTHRAS